MQDKHKVILKYLAPLPYVDTFTGQSMAVELRVNPVTNNQHACLHYTLNLY